MFIRIKRSVAMGLACTFFMYTSVAHADFAVTVNKQVNIEKELVSPILDIIKTAKDYDDLQDKLNNATLNGTNLQDTLTQSTTASLITGEKKDAQ